MSHTEIVSLRERQLEAARAGVRLACKALALAQRRGNGPAILEASRGVAKARAALAVANRALRNEECRRG